MPRRHDLLTLALADMDHNLFSYKSLQVITRKAKLKSDFAEGGSQEGSMGAYIKLSVGVKSLPNNLNDGSEKGK